MENLNGKRLLLLGGNNITDEIVSFAEKSGIVLISAGNRMDANIHRISKEHYNIDVTDSSALTGLMRSAHIDGIFSYSGEAVIDRTIEVIGDAGYHYGITRKQWETLMNKANFKRAAKEFGISVTSEYEISGDELNMQDVVFPVVVKPVDCGGSTGISVCRDAESVRRAIPLARKASSRGQVLAERFIFGSYFQFEIWVQNGKKYFAYSKDRVFYQAQGDSPEQPFLDIYPSENEPILKKAYYEPLSALFDSLSLKNGTVMFQGILCDGVPYIMDVAYRLSGGMDYLVVKEDKGIDIVRGYMGYALTGRWEENLSECEEPLRCIYATMCAGLKNGIIASVNGVDNVMTQDYVYRYNPFYRPGDEMTHSGKFAQTFCRVFMKGGSRKELLLRAAEVYRMLSVSDPEGAGLLLELPDEIKAYEEKI